MLLLFQLMPFCFMSFFVADRRFYQADVAAGLYAPSAYYLAAVTASKHLLSHFVLAADSWRFS